MQVGCYVTPQGFSFKWNQLPGYKHLTPSEFLFVIHALFGRLWQRWVSMISWQRWIPGHTLLARKDNGSESSAKSIRFTNYFCDILFL